MKLFDLDQLWINAEQKLLARHLLVVCNTQSAAQIVKKSGSFSMDTEYYSDDEFEQVVAMFSSLGLFTDYFTYEDDFFHYVIEHNPKNLIVYNSAQSGTGPGRKSLVPAFCNLHGISYTGSNAYVVSLCRHKYHVNQILMQAGIKVPQTWLYSSGAWLKNQHPPLDMTLLLKPIYESASIGIDNSSIQDYSFQTDQLMFEREKQHSQPIIAQEFIPGYEVEVPLIRVNGAICQLPPVGISIDCKRDLKNEILDYKRIYFDRYSFYDFSSENKELSRELCMCAAETAHVLGTEGLCRVDFRVTADGHYYVTDTSTNPHFITHSSVHFAFKLMGLEPQHIAKTLLSAAVERV